MPNGCCMRFVDGAEYPGQYTDGELHDPGCWNYQIERNVMSKDKSTKTDKKPKSAKLDDLAQMKRDYEAMKRRAEGPAGGGGDGAGIWDKLCLAAETHISYHSRGPDGKTRSVKGGSIERLFQVFNGIPGSGKGRYQKAWPDSSFFVSSMNDEGQIFKNQVMGVTYSGKKSTFYVRTAGGFEIEATDSHPFFTGAGYTPLASLKVGDTVFVQDGTQERDVPSHEIIGKRAYIYVKAHPIARTKTVDGKYEYKVLTRARAVVEADMNNLSLEAFTSKLNDSDLDGLKFLSKDVVVHHKDENFTNDTLSNLQVLPDVEHKRIHAAEHPMRHVAVPDVIEEICDAGEQDTYDITVNGPYHNFVAAGFVVHNSDGKNLRRILPRPGHALYYVTNHLHFRMGPDERTTLRCIAEPHHFHPVNGRPEPTTTCPVCKRFIREQARLNATYPRGDAESKALWAKAKAQFAPKTRHLFNVLTPEGDVKVHGCGDMIMLQLHGYFHETQDSQVGDFTDIESGRWMNIVRTGKAMLTKYVVRPGASTQDITEEWPQIQTMLHDLDKAAGDLLSPAQIEGILKGVASTDPDAEDEDD